MKISARNRLTGKIIEVTKGATTPTPGFELSCGQFITSSITNEAADELGLKVGRFGNSRYQGLGRHDCN